MLKMDELYLTDRSELQILTAKFVNHIFSFQNWYVGDE